MKRFLSTENIVRGVVIIALIAYIIDDFQDLNNIIYVLGMVLGMALIGAGFVNLYNGLYSYIKTKKWSLSKKDTLLSISLILVSSALLLIFLTPEYKFLAFFVVFGVLIGLLIMDLIFKNFKIW